MVTRSGIKVCGQDQGIGYGVKSREGQGWGSRSGVNVWIGVNVWGSRSGSRLWSRCRGQGQGSRSWGHGQGHDQWSQGWVNVRGQGQGSGQGQDEGVKLWRIGVRWYVGEVGDKHSVPFKNS